MSVTPFQSAILMRLARRRRERGESYVAGGLALNAILATPRRSGDVDLFHDTEAALSVTWIADRALLEANGYAVKTLREASSFVEAIVSMAGDHTIMQWARDSAFRFFPLVEDESMGLTLHPFDLATNKVLAMAGRLEVRDWVDALYCDESLQPLGCLLWAACGKDPGYNPHSLLAAASRLHYSQAEVDTLDFEVTPPDAAKLGERWHAALGDAGEIIACLPPEHVGKCVITRDANVFRGNATRLASIMTAGGILFHEGRIGGAWPRIAG